MSSRAQENRDAIVAETIAEGGQHSAVGHFDADDVPHDPPLTRRIWHMVQEWAELQRRMRTVVSQIRDALHVSASRANGNGPILLVQQSSVILFVPRGTRDRVVLIVDGEDVPTALIPSVLVAHGIVVDSTHPDLHQRPSRLTTTIGRRR